MIQLNIAKFCTKMNRIFKKTKQITIIQDSIQTNNTTTYTNEYHNNKIKQMVIHYRIHDIKRD